MKKITLTLLYLVCISTSYAQQLSNWYNNMQKYWWYRYRLVNDFMKIGDKAGESIPAQQRMLGKPDGDPIGKLYWCDATIDLGNYISMLSTEYKIMADNGWVTNRTRMELYYALAAFDRLDEDAEPYCYMVNGLYGHGGYPGSLTQSDRNVFANRVNGFFIRDDVPWLGLVNPWEPGNDYKHYNRPGITDDLHKVDEVHESAFTNRFHDVWPVGSSNPPIALTEPFASNSDIPVYPSEESQDQIVSLFTGMGLTSKLLDDNTHYNNIPLRSKAKDAAYRMISWIPSSIYTFPEDATYNFAHPNPTGNYWYIKNPLNNRCVYGINPDQWGNLTGHCSGGGALAMVWAPAGALAMKIVSGHNASFEMKSAAAYNDLLQATQNFQISIYQPNTRDIAFCDAFVAFARNWKFAPPNPPNLPGINTSWVTIRNHAMDNHFGNPHTPLVYKINYPGNRVGFQPEAHDLPSYENLLDWAPPCGTYNYNTEITGEWSGNNRLQEPYKRRGYQPQSPDDNTTFDSDFNGLDYMLLFNLYTYVKGDYLQFLINPYYTENYNTDYPHGQNGTATRKLTLNWLEYLSAINKINSGANVTFRGAKQLEFLPGFEAKSGSVFLGYVQDYSITCPEGSYNFATITEHVSDITNTYPIEYNPTDGSYVYYNPEEDFSEEDSWGEFVRPELTNQDSILAVLQGLTYNRAPKLESKSEVKLPKGNSVRSGVLSIVVYPNPNSGTFIVQFPDIGKYEVRVMDIVGVTIYKATVTDEFKKTIELPNNLAPGSYTIEIRGDNTNHVEKLTIYR